MAKRPKPTVAITDPNQVKNLPWQGNWAADEHLFDAVSAYVRQEPDPHRAYIAERDASIFGMGAALPEEPDENSLEYMRSLYKGK